MIQNTESLMAVYGPYPQKVNEPKQERIVFTINVLIQNSILKF